MGDVEVPALLVERAEEVGVAVGGEVQVPPARTNAQREVTIVAHIRGSPLDASLLMSACMCALPAGRALFTVRLNSKEIRPLDTGQSNPLNFMVAHQRYQVLNSIVLGWQMLWFVTFAKLE